jgi:hypothetical protein
MALQLGALREALIEAGASQEKASKAAEELAGYDQQLADVRSDLRLLKWMVGGIYIVGAPALWLLLRIADKVGALG